VLIYTKIVVAVFITQLQQSELE